MFSKQFAFRVLLSLSLLGGSVLNFPAAAQNTPRGSSGSYDSLLIGVDPNSGVLTGYFEEGMGQDERNQSPMFLCAFILYGKLQGDAYQLTTWYPDMGKPIKGWLKFVTADGVTTAHFKLEQEPGGCGMAHPSLARDDGDELKLSTPGKWASVRLVSAPRAFFYKAPNSRTKEKAYVVRKNVLRVFKAQNGWVEAEYDGDKVVRGWVKESDLLPMLPK